MRPACEQCHGTGWKIKALSGEAARAVAERCSCVMQHAAGQRSNAARIPRHFLGSGFGNFEAEEVRLREAKEACQKVVRGWPQARKGLVLMGSPGVGKTHLAVATLRGLLEQGADGLFYDFRDLLDQLRSSYDEEKGSASESSILQRVFGAEVLVLDELGSEKLTDWVREVVHRIIIRRYNDERLTIFTTNYLDKEILEEILKREPDPLETLEGRIGNRLRSRLYEMCETVYLGGRDWRRQDEQLKKVRGPTEAARPVETDPADPLAQWIEALLKLPEHVRQPWILEAKRFFQSPMTPAQLVHRKAAELYRNSQRMDTPSRRD